jgi:hypothetical protein
MVPAQSNYETAQQTFNEFLAAVPKAFGLKDFAEKLVICLLEDVVRASMMFVHCDHSAFKLIPCVGCPSNLGCIVLLLIFS